MSTSCGNVYRALAQPKLPEMGLARMSMTSSLIVLTACGGMTGSATSLPPHGSYEGTLSDPNNAAHPRQPIRLTFFADGNFFETQQLYQSPSPFKSAILASPGQGMWVSTGAHQGKAVFSIDLFLVGGAADGTLLSQETVTWTFHVDADTNAVVGPWKAVVRAAASGAVVAMTAGSVEARPANHP